MLVFLKLFWDTNLRKLQITDFEQSWKFFPFFRIFWSPIFDRFTHSFISKFYAQPDTTNLRNKWTYFNSKNNQPFSKNQARKVKFYQFTCNKTGNKRFAVK